MIEHFDFIWWEDSWLLGWEMDDDALTLYVELHLLRDHPLFQPFDRQECFGCYKTARLIVSGLQGVSGLSSDRHGLQWDNALHEYRDVGDIDAIKVGPNGQDLLMDISNIRAADDFRLSATGRSVDLVFGPF
ncbi:MAG: hypothetical protein RLN99_19885 [Kiloniellaceae bacterium]